MKPALLLYPHISAYPALLLLGFVCGWLLARSRAARFGIEKRHLDNLALLLPVAGLFGARFFARYFYAKTGLWEALKVWEGDGLVFYGGFLFGAAAVLGYGFANRIRMLALLDSLAPAIALGLAFGRIGCFMAGCCWGDVCLDSARTASVDAPEVRSQIQTFPALSTPGWPLAVEFPAGSPAFAQHVKHGLISPDAPHSAPVHPVQLYEAGLAFLLCGFLLVLRGRQPGDLALCLLVGYAFIRFGTEFLRADNKQVYWSLTLSQTISLGLLGFAMVCAAVRRFIPKSSVPVATAPYKPHPASG